MMDAKHGEDGGWLSKMHGNDGEETAVWLCPLCSDSTDWRRAGRRGLGCRGMN